MLIASWTSYSPKLVVSRSSRADHWRSYRLLHRDGNPYVEFRIDSEAISHRGKEFPLPQGVEQNLIEARIRRRLGEGHLDGAIWSHLEMRDGDSLENILAQVVWNRRRRRVD